MDVLTSALSIGKQIEKLDFNIFFGGSFLSVMILLSDTFSSPEALHEICKDCVNVLHCMYDMM